VIYLFSWRIFLKKEYSVANSKSLFFNHFAKTKSPKISTIAYNMKGCLRFSISYHKSRHIWLNILMIDCHLSNITKLILKNIAGGVAVGKRKKEKIRVQLVRQGL